MWEGYSMPEKKSFEEYINLLKENEVINMQNPLCIDCNECCSMTAQLEDEEYFDLLEFIKTKEGKAIYQQGLNRIKRYFRQGTIYMMCPFTDEVTKKCRIYDIRPKVCRSFHCSTSTSPTTPKKYSIGNLFLE